MNQQLLIKSTPDYQIEGMFPLPLYIAKRDSNLDSTEEKEIEDIIEEGMYLDSNMTTHNTYIFNNKLKKLKQFCEMHIDNYVKQLLNHEEEINYYITQSWLSITNPGEYHHPHYHSNSLISGVFYLATEEDDSITFEDMNFKIKQQINIEPKEWNVSNAVTWTFPAITNELIMFPSWLNHRVLVNEKATTDRISISFNTFVSGTLGVKTNLNELILK